MSYRLAVVVPVAAVPGERARWSELAHRYIPLAHARAQAELGAEVHVLFDGVERSTEALDPGVTVHCVPGRLPAVRGVVRGPHLVRAAARLRPDVVHLHHLLAAEQLGYARALDAPVFAEFHGGAPPRWGLKRRALRWASRGLAGAFFPAAAYRDRLVAAGAWAAAVPTVVSPEATSRFEALAPRVGARGPRILVVGRCEAPKAPLLTVEVLAAIARRAPAAEFQWATPGGAEHAAVQARLREVPELQGRLRMANVPFSKMAETYAAADVLVVTSEREIGGTVLSEALSQGTPVAGFTLPTFEALGGACPAVRLVAPRDPAALAEAALDLARARDLRAVARAHFEGSLSFAAIAAARAARYRALG